MVWPFARKAAAPDERKSLSANGIFFGTRLLTPPAASYSRLASEGYGQNAVAYACANRIAAAVASVELHLFRETKGGVERVTDSKLLTLLDRPNPLQSGREFLGHLASYFALSGNAYVHAAGLTAQPKQLYLFSPGHVTVEAGRYAGVPREYVYKPTAADDFRYPVDPVTARCDVLHVKTFNPLSPWYGMAPMDAAALAIDLHNAGNVWNYSLLKQGARPSGALIAKGVNGQQANLSDEQFARLKAMLDEEYSGAGNSGKPLLLEGGLEWQEMSLSPKDVDFLEGKHSAAREIALAFGVPPQLLGIPGDATYSNMAEAKLAFWTDCVLPLLQLVIGGLNRWLTPLYGDGLYLWYDEEMIPALEPLRAQKAERIEGSACLTLNEKRRALGYDDYTPGESAADQLYIESSKIPLELAGQIDLPEPGSAADEPDA